MASKEPDPGSNRVRFLLRAEGASPDEPDPLCTGIHHRGYLPHVKLEGASYFVTFRLADSLPQSVLLRFLDERTERLQALKATRSHPPNAVHPQTEPDRIEQINRDYQRNIERYLDQGAGACHLRRPEIASMMVQALRYAHGSQYLLDDWVIMPNHVHLILRPLPTFTLSEILQGRKQFTATHANRILGRTGQPFWQRESYDHWIRDDEELTRIRRYIRANPVKAGLCAHPEDWPWSSAHNAGEAPAP